MNDMDMGMPAEWLPELDLGEQRQLRVVASELALCREFDRRVQDKEVKKGKPSATGGALPSSILPSRDDRNGRTT